MGVRETLQKKQWISGVIAGVVIVGAIVAIIIQARSYGSTAEGDAYFTDDDGATFFTDDGKKQAPFDRNGKQAVRAHVFECGGKRVVGFMSGYTPEALKLVAEAQKYKGTGKPPPNAHPLASGAPMGLMAERPGDAAWVPQADAGRGTMVRVFRCPDGSTPQEVEP